LPGNLYGALLIGFFLVWGLLHHWLLRPVRDLPVAAGAALGYPSFA
jgi:hypothetical protein